MNNQMNSAAAAMLLVMSLTGGAQASEAKPVEWTLAYLCPPSAPMAQI